MNEDMNENRYMAHKKTSTQNRACSQRQIHTVHTYRLSREDDDDDDDERKTEIGKKQRLGL